MLNKKWYEFYLIIKNISFGSFYNKQITNSLRLIKVRELINLINNINLNLIQKHPWEVVLITSDHGWCFLFTHGCASIVNMSIIASAHEDLLKKRERSEIENIVTISFMEVWKIGNS